MPRFLLDENVRVELHRFLKSQNVDVRIVPRSTPDSFIASLSKKENRILVTNDEDFCEYDKEEIFSVVWLRIPQNDPKALIAAFNKLLIECPDFSGRLILLKADSWTNFSLDTTL